MTAQQKLFKVLVIGEACTDEYIHCINTRLNPESSAPLVTIKEKEYRLGMAFNVKTCLENLGVQVTILSPIDSHNKLVKTRYINSKTKEQLLRVDIDSKLDLISDDLIKDIVTKSNYDAIVISDYNKGYLSYDSINNITKYYDKAIFLDTKKNILSKFDNTRIIIKINEHEANAANIVPKGTIVTMGDNGVSWYGERWSAYKSDTVDVCGAGDAFMAGFVYGYLHNLSECIEYGIVNAGISVRHIGIYAPTNKELMAGLDDYYKQTRNN